MSTDWVTDPTALELIIRFRGLKEGDGVQWRHKETGEVQQYAVITSEVAVAAQDYFVGVYIYGIERAWRLSAWKPAG